MSRFSNSSHIVCFCCNSESQRQFLEKKASDKIEILRGLGENMQEKCPSNLNIPAIFRSVQFLSMSIAQKSISRHFRGEMWDISRFGIEISYVLRSHPSTHDWGCYLKFLGRPRISWSKAIRFLPEKVTLVLLFSRWTRVEIFSKFRQNLFLKKFSFRFLPHYLFGNAIFKICARLFFSLFQAFS